MDDNPESQHPKSRREETARREVNPVRAVWGQNRRQPSGDFRHWIPLAEIVGDTGSVVNELEAFRDEVHRTTTHRNAAIWKILRRGLSHGTTMVSRASTSILPCALAPWMARL
jgi:hypothetical protein